MKVLLLPLLFALVAADASIDVNGDSYNFNYATGDVGGHQRSESGSGGAVSGSYSYTDPNGNVRTVTYTAGPGGFQPSGDISVDKKTAEEAARIAALAPKAPEVPAAVAPWYGNWWGHPGANWYGNWAHGAPWYGAWGAAPHAWSYSHGNPHWAGRWW